MYTTGFSVSTYSAIFAILALGCYAIPLSLDTSFSCAKSQWRDIIVFFFVNYLAHAATIPSQPGSKWFESLLWSLLSLLLPFAGLGRSIAKIAVFLEMGKDDVQKAISQGALVIVARNKDWEPPSTSEELVYMDLPQNFDDFTEIQAENTPVTFELDTIQWWKYSDLQALDLHDFEIQGNCSPPAGYRAVIPDYNVLRAISLGTLKHTSKIKLSRSQSWLTMASSIAQLIFSAITLARARGSQTARYGYAAFGLSVFPYTFMSLINFICVGMVGNYSYKHILRTSILDEAQRCGGDFDGTVGVPLRETGDANAEMEKREGCYTPFWLSTEMKTAEDSTTQKMLVVRKGQSTRRFKLFKSGEIPGALIFGVSSLTNQAERPKIEDPKNMTLAFLFFVGLLSVLVLPYVVINGFTKFKEEESTRSQRAWMMAWLCGNQLSFFPLAFLSIGNPSVQISSGDGVFVLMVSLLPAVAAIGGFVTVGKMLVEFGTCSASSLI